MNRVAYGDTDRVNGLGSERQLDSTGRRITHIRVLPGIGKSWRSGFYSEALFEHCALNSPTSVFLRTLKSL